MTLLVSILIPAYNAEKWIADTLRSAIAQTWERKEIIVVDDGSTDRTLEMARKFESDFIKVVTQENQGGPAARNKAFSLSQGHYVQWLDHDDLLDPDKIAKQMAVVSSGISSKTLLSSCWGEFSYRPHRARFTPSALWCDLTPVEYLLRRMEQNLFMQTGVWLVSRELTEVAGPWDTSMLTDDDGEYFCRVLLASDGIRFVPDAKAYWRILGAGQGSYIGQSDRKLEAKYKAMQMYVGYLLSLEDSTRARTACVKYFQGDLVYFHDLRPDLAERLRLTAHQLGGELETPSLSWKYSWIKALFGWNQARRSQLFMRSVKWSLSRSYDKALARVENRKSASQI